MNEFCAMCQNTPVSFLLALFIVSTLLFLVTFLPVFLVSYLFNKCKKPNFEFVFLVTLVINTLIWVQVLNN